MPSNKLGTQDALCFPPFLPDNANAGQDTRGRARDCVSDTMQGQSPPYGRVGTSIVYGSLKADWLIPVTWAISAIMDPWSHFRISK